MDLILDGMKMERREKKLITRMGKRLKGQNITIMKVEKREEK